MKDAGSDAGSKAKVMKGVLISQSCWSSMTKNISIEPNGLSTPSLLTGWTALDHDYWELLANLPLKTADQFGGLN